MSGFEDYPQELSRIDREIFHYAAVCAVDLGDALALKQCLAAVHDEWSEDKARQSLRGLLMLRLKVEAEMIERGLAPPPLLPAGESGAGDGLQGLSDGTPAAGQAGPKGADVATKTVR